MMRSLCQALNEILLGKEEVVRLAVSCLLADGHLLLEDIPGMGKTTLAHALAHFTGMQYRRVQFTSDLLPSDLLGVSVYDSEAKRFQFHPGPIFTGLLLADEINRATPKTQSALLEAMEEHQVSSDAGTVELPKPFFVIATQNPAYQTGTYPLPESQLDRFMMCLSIGYPSKEAERALLEGVTPRDRLEHLAPVIDLAQLLLWQQKILTLTVAPVVIDYVQALLQCSRVGGIFEHGLSPRAGRALLRAAMAYAFVSERDFVRPDDVQAVLGALVNHRLVIKKANADLTPSHMLLQQVEVPL